MNRSLRTEFALLLSLLLASAAWGEDLLQREGTAPLEVKIRLAEEAIPAGETVGVEIEIRNVSGRTLSVYDKLLPTRSDFSPLSIFDHPFLGLERQTGETWELVRNECAVSMPSSSVRTPVRLPPGGAQVLHGWVGGVCKSTLLPGRYRVYYERYLNLHVQERGVAPGDPEVSVIPNFRLTSEPVELTILPSTAARQLDAARGAIARRQLGEAERHIGPARTGGTARSRAMATLLEALAADDHGQFRRAAALYDQLKASPLRDAANFVRQTFPESIEGKNQ